jgi:hypothetical protein
LLGEADLEQIKRKTPTYRRGQIGNKRLWKIDISALVRHDGSMDRVARERLGHYIVSRRVALGYRNRSDLASSLPFTVRTLADVEHGVRKASPGTYAMLENKLAWAPGSIDAILAGGEPRETVPQLRRAASLPVPHFSSDTLSRASTEELLLELRRRIVAKGRQRHQTWDDGLDAHGDWSEQG